MSFLFRRFLLVLAFSGLVSHAADLEISTSDYLIEPGQEVQVDVRVDNADPLIIFSVIVHWDDSLVEFVPGFGVQMGPRVISSENNVQSDLLSVTSFSILGDPVITAGTGTLFSFKLKGLQRGVSPITFSNVTATATAGDVTDQAITSGSVDMGIGDVVVTPAGGTYSGGQTVSLSADGAETIYYTTDGTEPTTSSTVYATPLDISGPDGSNKRLRVLAVSASDRTSTANELYIFASASPEPTIDLNAGQQDPTNSGTIVFAITFSEDVTGFEQADVQLSGTALPTNAALAGGPRDFTVTVTGMTTAGTVIIDFPAGVALDAATNAPSTSPTLADNSVFFDQVAPDSDITTTGTQGSDNWPGSVNGTASDVGSGVATVEVAVERISDGKHWNGVSWGNSQIFLAATGTTDWQLPLPANDLHDDELYLIQSRAIDAAGNTQSPNASSSFTFDASVPTGTFFIAFGNPAITTSTSTSLFISVSDATQMRFQNAGGGFTAWFNYASFVNWTLLNQDGEQTVNAEFRNAGGNVLQLSDTILVDLDPPTCSATTVGPFGPNTWTGFVSGTASDTVSALDPVEIAIRRNSDNKWFDGATWSSTQTYRNATGFDPWSVPLTETALSNGETYRIFCRVSDAAGHEALFINDEFSWDDAPPTGSFTINSGDPEFAISATVDLHMNVTGASEMRFKNDGGEFSNWMPFSAVLEDWVLKQRDGSRQVDGEFRDDAGNLLAVNDGVTLDTSGPNGSFSIGIGDPALGNNTNTVLFMLVSDAVQMRFRNAGDANFGPWEPYLNIKSWTLPDNDGLLTVEGEFQDLAGNITQLSDSITLDTDPPTGELSIGNGNPAYTSSPSVTLFNIVVGATEMRFHNGSSAFGNWMPVAPSLAWTLVDTDGVRSVTAQYRDAALNTLTRSDTIILDRTAPSCAIATSGFFGTVNWTGQVVGTAADSASGIASVVLTIQRDSDSFYFNGAGWAAGETQLAAIGTTNWTYLLDVSHLNDGFGYEIRAQSTDNVGLISTEVSSSFTFDENPPACVIDISGAYRSADWPGTLSGTVTDSVSGIANITVSVQRVGDGFFFDGADFAAGQTLLPVTGTAPWSAPLPVGVLAENESYILRCQVADNAGNFADSASVTFTLDDTAPTGSFVINAGNPTFVTDDEVTLVNSVTGAAEMRFANDAEGFVDDWQPYQPSLSWTLNAIDGARIVRGEYRDIAGNVLSFSDAVVLDLLPPQGGFTIGSGDPAFVSTRSQQLSISVTGATEMRFRNDGEQFGDWIQAGAVLNWDLRDSEGTRTVFGEFRDLAGNIITPQDDTLLDRLPPSCSLVTASFVGPNSWPGHIAGSAADAGSGLAPVRITLQRQSDNLYYNSLTWQVTAVELPVSGTTDWTFPHNIGLLEHGETYVVSCIVADLAGNPAPASSDSFTFDNVVPSGSITTSGLFRADNWPNQISGSASDALSGVGEIRVSVQRDGDGAWFTGSGWQVTETHALAQGQAPWNLSLAIGLLSDGESYSLSAVIVDAAGNTANSAGSSFSIDTSAPAGTFTIGAGDPAYTLGIAVTLTNGITGATEMRFADEGQAFGDWEAFATTKEWVLPNSVARSDDGPRKVLAEFRDAAGNVGAFEDSIILDTIVPVGGFTIGAGDPTFVSTRSVTLAITVAGATEMRFANANESFGDFVAYASELVWELNDGDGQQSVRGEFRDDAGNTIAANDVVTLDTQPPVGSFAVDGSLTNTLDVTLLIGVTGATEMRFRNDGETFAEVWLPFASTANWTVRDADGERGIFGEFRDDAGQILSANASVTIDRVPPGGSFSIGQGDPPATGTRDVTLVAAISEAVEMRFANDDEAFGDWIALANESNWQLADLDGIRTTKAEFRDDAGNVLELNDIILLDRTPPSCTIDNHGTVGPDWPDAVTGTTSDAGSGVGQGVLTIRRDSDNHYWNGLSWVNALVPFAISTDWSIALPSANLHDGQSYTFTCTVFDNVGNSSGPQTATVFLDNEDPTCTITTAGSYNATTWADEVAGTAADGVSGLAIVFVTLSRQSDGFFWDGANWVDGEVNLNVTGTDWSVPLSLANLTDGSYDVTCDATDLAGNTANSASSTFSVDATLPVGGMTIGVGDPAKVNDPRVTLVNTVTGATQMRTRQLDGVFGGFIPYAATIHWDLPDQDGEHLVQMEFRDDAGNSILLSDGVILDRSPPSGSFTIGETDPALTRFLDLELFNSAVDAVEMRFRDENGTFGDFVPYADTVMFTLSAGEGERTIFGEYRDDAGNVLGASDTIFVDTRPPTGSFDIGITVPDYVNSIDVKLTLRIDAVTEMRFANDDGPFSDWIAFTDTVNYQLQDLDGVRVVHAEFRDAAGNVLALQDDVLLDRVPPTCSITTTGVFQPATWTDDASGTAVDNASGIASVGIIVQRMSDLRYYTGQHWVGDETLVQLDPPDNWSIDFPVARVSNGLYEITCIPVDGAGNEAIPEVQTFFFDDGGPLCESDMEGPYTADSWPGAITGTVTDPSGISSVEIRLRRSNGHYWEGTHWVSTPTLLPVTGTGTWSYSITKEQLQGEDTYTVHCVAADSANNVTDAVITSFVLDTEPPTGGFTIGENDPERTGSRNVLLRNAVTGATLMRFRNAGEEFPEAWQAFSISKNWVLPDLQPEPGAFDNGLAIVHAEFQDANGNILQVSDSVTLDTVAPTGTFTINGGEVYSTNNSVTLDFDVEGATNMSIRNGGSSAITNISYVPSRQWQLSAGDGTRSVQVIFADGVGNTHSVTKSIIVDTTRPTGSFFIFSSTTTYATTEEVTLRSFVSGATEMRFRNDNEDFADWVPYGETHAWLLRDQDGQRQVFAEYRDVAGNVLSLNDFIFRDVTPPTCDVLTEGLLSTQSWPGSLRGKGDDNASGIDIVTITFFRHVDNLWYNGTNWTSDPFNLNVSGSDSWSYPFTAPELVASTYTIACTIRDNAGNSGVDTVEFIWDTSPPTCEINMGTAYNINTWPGAIVGTASDHPSGVETVTITLQRSSDSLYWHDTVWAVDPFPLIANGTDNWTLPMNIGVLAVDATYTATCVATDFAGLSSPVDSVSFVVDGAAPEGAFVINPGNPTHTASANVVLHSNVDGAIEMRFANEGEAFGDWEPYATTKNWLLPEDVARTSSVKTVQAEFKDVADNVLPLADSIFFDDEAPTGSFAINVGDPEGTNSRNTVLVLTVDGATEMRVGNDNGQLSQWVPLQSSFAWELADVQGLRTVNLEVRDEAGNVHIMDDTVILDTIAPTGSFELNQGNPGNTNSRTIEIVINIEGASEMRFKNSDGEFSAWQAFANSFSWELTDREGIHTVQGEFVDVFGNVKEFNDNIILDQVLPDCQVSTTGIFHNFEWPGFIQGSSGDETSGVGSVAVSIHRGKDGFYYDGVNWVDSETAVLVNPVGPWSISMPTAKLLDDRYTVTCTVTDLANNVGTCTGVFSIDDSPPSCSINTGLFSTLNWEGVSGTATDLESGVGTITVIVRRDTDGLFYDGAGWGSTVVLHDVDVAENWVLPLDVSLLHNNVTYSVDCVVRDLAGNLGPTDTGSFSYDGIPPSGDFRVHDSEFVNSFDIILLNFVSDASQMRFQNDGEEFSEWFPYASAMNWTLRAEDGDRTVFAEYRDVAGNLFNLQDSINVDSTPPDGGFSIGEGNPAETRVTDVTLYIDVTDAHEMRFRDPGGQFTAWESVTATKPWTIADVEGDQTVEGEFRDIIGNVLQTSDSIELDRLPPQGSFTINLGDPQYALNRDVTLFLAIDDGFEMRIANDDDAFPEVWIPFSTSPQWQLADVDGLRTVNIEVRDSAGGSATFSDTVTLDSTPPDCTTSVNGTYNGETWPGLITGNLSDATSGITSGSISLQRVSDGGYWTGSFWAPSRTLISITPGSWLVIIGPPSLTSDEYLLSCFAGDVAGNTRSASPVSFIYDAQQPDCTIDTSGDLGIITWPDVITGTASDALSDIGSVSVSVQRRGDGAYFDGQAWVGSLTQLSTTGLESWSVDMPGQHLSGGETYDITCTATDSQGNERQRFSTFSVDNIPPSGTFVIAEGNPIAVSNRNVVLHSDMTDAIDMRFSNDGIVFTEWMDYADTFAWVLPDVQGPLDVFAEFRDHVGNVLQISDTVTFDNQPPTGTFTIGAGDPEVTTSADVFLQVNVVGASQMRFRNDDGVFSGFNPVSAVFPWSLTGGDNETRTVHAEFRDFAGNLLVASDSVIIDNVGPSGSFTVGSGDPDFTKSILTTLISTVTDAVDMRFRNNSDPFGAFEPYTSVRIWTLPNIGGTHTIDGQFRDNRGNILSISDQITLDLDAPTAAISTVGNYGSGTWPNEIAGTATDPSSGVDRIEVAVQRQSDGRYFDGVSWVTGQQLLNATGTNSWSLPLDVSFLTDATSYSVIAIAHDEVGNSSAPVSRSFNFDSSAPPCTINTTGVFGPNTWPGAISGAADATGDNGLQTVTVSIQRSSDGQFWNGSGWRVDLHRLTTIGNAEWSLSLPAGQLHNSVTYLISCHPEDNVGNVGNDQRQFVFDAQPPSFSFDPDIVNIPIGTPPDLVAGVNVSDNVDDNVFASITTQGNIDFNTTGDYTITYHATDSAGNSGSGSRVFRVGLIVSGEVSYSGLQSGNTVVVLDGPARNAQIVTIPGGVGPFEFAVGDGAYTLYAFMDITPNQAIDPTEPVDQSLPVIVVAGQAVSDLQLRLADWTHTFNLHTGWNLISLPGPLVDPILGNAMPEVIGPAVTFDGESQTYLEAFSLQPRQGFWVYTPQQRQSTVRGTYDLVSNVPLYEGWNLLGVRLAVPHPAFTNQGVRVVWGPSRRGLRILTAGDQLLPFRGYWINTSVPGTFTTGQ